MAAEWAARSTPILVMQTNATSHHGTLQNFTFDFPNRLGELDRQFRPLATSADLEVTYTLMKLAAALALAALAKESVPKEICKAYGVKQLEFGPDYLIPKPLDPRVLLREAPAVAEAAMKGGVARHPIANLEAYRASLAKRMKIEG